MPTILNMPNGDHSIPGWLKRFLDNLRSQLGWWEVLVGVGAVAAISFLVLDIRYQSIPTYKVGEIATVDVRAFQDLAFEDTAETAKKQEIARQSVPALYDVFSDILVTRESEINKAFETARQLLSASQAPVKGSLSRNQEAELLRLLAESLRGSLSEDLIPVLLKNRFNRTLEAKIIRVLQSVMRPGIVSNRAQFSRDQRAGIILRDTTTSSEQPVSDLYSAKDLTEAREQLRQFEREFVELSPSDRERVLTFVEELLVPTIAFNPTETALRRDIAAKRVTPVQVQIRKGKTLVRSGDEITPAITTQLAGLRSLQQPNSLFAQLLGFFLIAATLVYAIWRYFVHHQNRHRKIRAYCLLVLVILVAVLGVVRLLTKLADILSERVAIDAFRDPYSLYYAIPFAFGAVLITLLVDTNVSILASMILATLTGLMYGDIYMGVYVIMGSLAGMYSVRQYKDRAAILKAGLTIGLVNAVGILAIECLRHSSVAGALSFFSITMAFAGGMQASALSSVLLPALESLFKVTTDIRLLELSNLNAPVLRRLSVEAPGTYHHSLMVGTLGEAAAEAIGANPLLVRVGAYYHDLGKLLKPEYFVENQIFGVNKHEDLSPSMSSLIIAAHVKDGLELAKEIGLAERIRDMIPQHHGTRIMTYFYQKAKDSVEAKNQQVLETDFRYPGPKPQSKEAAIMMMADSVEAASRTLSHPTQAQIQGMVDRLVDAIIADNQFEECDITLREVRLVKESFCKILRGIYHRRIDYPGYDFKKIEEPTAKAPAGSPGAEPTETVQSLRRRH